MLKTKKYIRMLISKLWLKLFIFLFNFNANNRYQIGNYIIQMIKKKIT